jgi:hypothetical protein
MVTMKVIDQGQKKTVKVPADGTWVEHDGTFFCHHNPNFELCWRPNLPGADQVAVANTIKAVTKPDRSIDPSQLNSLPKGSWVAVNYKNQKLDLFNLFQVGDQPLATKGPDGKIPTFDDSVLKGRLSTPDLCHFSATATAGFYGKYFTDGSKAFQVSDNEAAQLIEATRQAPHVASGHIGTNSVRRYKNFAQKLAMGLAAPFAMFALIRNPLG